MSRYQISIEKGVCVSGILSSIDRTGIKEVVLDKRVFSTIGTTADEAEYYVKKHFMNYVYDIINFMSLYIKMEDKDSNPFNLFPPVFYCRVEIYRKGRHHRTLRKSFLFQNKQIEKDDDNTTLVISARSSNAFSTGMFERSRKDDKTYNYLDYLHKSKEYNIYYPIEDLKNNSTHSVSSFIPPNDFFEIINCEELLKKLNEKPDADDDKSLFIKMNRVKKSSILLKKFFNILEREVDFSKCKKEK